MTILSSASDLHRHMRGDTPASVLIAVISVARPLRSEAMCALTRLSTSRSSLLRASSMTVGNNSRNWATSRYDTASSTCRIFADRNKSHQNKFHAATLRYLTQKFANISPGDWVSREDKELWEYFASLYKNSNKGIKGRGKDRRISAVSGSGAMHSMYTPLQMGSVDRNFSNFHQHGSDRSSRGSSLSSDATYGTHARSDSSYEYGAPVNTGYPPQEGGYDDMVFPERKMY